jgi:hypothetical protein
MYAIVRTFSGPGAKALFDLLENRKAEVDVAMRSVPGLEVIRCSAAETAVFR